jgi:hypothetical protein
VGVNNGQLEGWLALPVAMLPISGTLCRGNGLDDETVAEYEFDTHPKPLVGVETAVSADGQVLVVRSSGRNSCRAQVEATRALLSGSGDSEAAIKFAESICQSRGVYAWRRDRLAKREDGLVMDGPSPLDRRAALLRGPCVDPESHLRHEQGDDVPEDAFVAVTSDIDLDGDGVFDSMFNVGAARWEVTYALYVRRGICAHSVGVIASSEWPRRVPQRSHGLYDLLTSTDGATAAGKAYGFLDVTWRFDGRAYRPSSIASTPRRPAGIRP